ANSRTASRIRGISSGTAALRTAVQPSCSTAAWRAGPLRSEYPPPATRSLTVRMPVAIMRRRSVEVDGAAFAVLDGQLRGAFLAEHGDAQGLNVRIDSLEFGQAPPARRLHAVFGAFDAFEGGVEQRVGQRGDVAVG